jgi:hypothetical protein
MLVHTKIAIDVLGQRSGVAQAAQKTRENSGTGPRSQRKRDRSVERKPQAEHRRPMGETVKASPDLSSPAAIENRHVP